MRIKVGVVVIYEGTQECGVMEVFYVLLWVVFSKVYTYLHIYEN